MPTWIFTVLLGHVNISYGKYILQDDKKINNIAFYI